MSRTTRPMLVIDPTLLYGEVEIELELEPAPTARIDAEELRWLAIASAHYEEESR